MPMHYGVFDVLLDSNADTTCCPRCSEFVQPLTCAFSKCEWKLTGLKGQPNCTENAQAAGARAMPSLLLLMLTALTRCCCLLHCSLCSASVLGDPAQRTQSLDWSKAGNEYARFDPSDVKEGGSGVVAWLRLKIVTRDPEESHSETRTCSVCLGTDVKADGERPWIRTPCSHNFHSNCLDAWKSQKKLQGHGASCPMCRHALA